MKIHLKQIILFNIFLFISMYVNAHQQEKSTIRQGEQIFKSYCSGCHSLKYFRYKQVAMPPADARQWFGMIPPDLSLIAKERGSSWLYTFLQSFYADSHRPFGTNNYLVPDINMPNILEPLQKELNKVQFDNTLNELVAFLVYVSEPEKLLRIRIGFGVILFLCIFVVVVYQLKTIYWQKMKL